MTGSQRPRARASCFAKLQSLPAACIFLAVVMPCLPLDSSAQEVVTPAVVGDPRIAFVSAEPPNCGSYSIDGSRKYPPQSYCTGADTKQIGEHTYISFIKSFSPHTVVSVHSSYYAIDNPDFVGAICSLAKNGANHIQLTMQAELPLDGIRSIVQCSNDAGASVDWRTLGRDQSFSSFHLKILLLEKNDGTAFILTGSGNPTINSEAYHDYEVGFAVPLRSPFALWHSCVLAAVEVQQHQTTESIVKSNYQKCSRARSQTKSVIPYLLPFDGGEFLSKWRLLSSSAKRIDIIVQHVGSSPLRKLILDALSKGTQVRIIMDDDVVWAKRAAPTSPETKYFNSNREWDQWVKPLLDAGAEFRFVPTNHHATPRNFVHMKLVNFVGADEVKTSVFWGAKSYVSRNIQQS